MNKFKKYFWNLEDLFQLNKSKNLLVFQILGIIFVAYIIFSSLGMDAKSIKESSLELYEIIIICSYIIVFTFGILLNFKILNIHFIGQSAKALIFILGRTIVLIGIAFIITFMIKFLCMVIFKIPPMTLNKYNYLNEIIWFFPIVQLIYFFNEIKRHNSNLLERD